MSDAVRVATRRFRAAGTAVEAYAAAVEAARQLLDADVCEFLLDADGRSLVRASSSSQSDDLVRSHPDLLGIPESAYTTDNPCLVDDLHDTRRAVPEGSSRTAATDHRSLCCAPVDGHGVLLAKAHSPGAFDVTDRDLVEQIAAATRAALDRIDTETAPALANGGTRQYPDHADRLDEVADILSHDLKNPLNVAKGNLQLARESGDDELLDRAEAALDRIEGLVDEVVFLARTGELVERTEEIELGEAVRAAWDNVQTTDATLAVEESASVDASGRAFNHVLENLIENAVTHAGPTVTVRVGVTDDGFYVEDDGPGVPAEHRDRIFERGYSLAGDSTGLGLSIVTRIVEAHGWRIGVEASPEDGARFVIAGIDPR